MSFRLGFNRMFLIVLPSSWWSVCYFKVSGWAIEQMCDLILLICLELLNNAALCELFMTSSNVVRFLKVKMCLKGSALNSGHGDDSKWIQACQLLRISRGTPDFFTHISVPRKNMQINRFLIADEIVINLGFFSEIVSFWAQISSFRRETMPPNPPSLIHYKSPGNNFCQVDKPVTRSYSLFFLLMEYFDSGCIII